VADVLNRSLDYYECLGSSGARSPEGPTRRRGLSGANGVASVKRVQDVFGVIPNQKRSVIFGTRSVRCPVGRLPMSWPNRRHALSRGNALLQLLEPIEDHLKLGIALPTG
jgi:hypothetical protein